MMDNEEAKHSIIEQAKLCATQLRKTVDPTIFEFETTEEVPELSSIIGQERGSKVMRFGLQVDKSGYNIYVAGIPGTGKTTFTNSIMNDIAKKEVELFDWCYVYNFTNSYRPRVIQLPVGMGKVFQYDMEVFLHHMITDIPRAFNEENYQKERATIIRKYKEERNAVFERLNELAKQYGFIIRQSGSGFISIPLREGEPMSEENYKSLSSDELAKIDEKSSQLEVKVLEFTNEFHRIEKAMNETIEKLDEKVALAAIGHHLANLQEKYRNNEAVVHYFEAVQDDMLKNIEDFLEKKETDEISQLFASRQQTDFKMKYKVNLLVDNSETTGSPVVTADNPTFYNLIGKVEYENRMGVMTTDFTKIKPGFLHEANGGYIIIQAKDILSKGYAWEALKRALHTGKLAMENIGEHTGLVTTTSLNPDPIPLNIKVILIGNREMYQILHYYDEDFSKLFKIKADFDIEMDFNIENMSRLASLIHSHCKAHDLLPFDRTAVAKIAEFSRRLAGHQEKLSTKFNQIVEIIYEADTWSKIDGAKIVTATYVNKAISENEYRYNLIEEKMQESIEMGNILIATEGEVVGQVNGLAVYSTGQYSFGKPARITATTFVGRNGIINIERESKLSGNIHNKGVYILSGYLGEQFAQRHPLAMTAHLTFEQSYGGIDGDSASSTELYALLSSLAQIPIKQGFAVTGSVNQKGEIQPIGGVNEKIEGFFEVCKKNGFTRQQGVIIPHQNVMNLMLKTEVVTAVKKGDFHLYAVRTIEEGIEILTGIPAGKKLASGLYEPNTVYRKVADQLEKYIQISKSYQTGEEES